MSFYKRDGEELLVAPNFVHGPGFSLTEALRGTYTYPVEGWTWYDTLDQALVGVRSNALSITALQAKTALHRAGLLITVEAMIAQSGVEAQLAWATASNFERSSTLLNNLAQALGLTAGQLDELFLTASQITV